MEASKIQRQGADQSAGQRREHPNRGRPLPQQVPGGAARRPVAPVGDVQHAHVRRHLVAPVVRPRPVVGEVDAVSPHPGAPPGIVRRDAQRRALPEEQRAPAQDAVLAVRPRPLAGGGRPLEELDAGGGVLYVLRPGLQPPPASSISFSIFIFTFCGKAFDPNSISSNDFDKERL